MGVDMLLRETTYHVVFKAGIGYVQLYVSALFPLIQPLLSIAFLSTEL